MEFQAFQMAENQWVAGIIIPVSGVRTLLAGGFKYFFNFHPYLGMISNLTNIFQMGWNHQLG